MDTSAFLNYLIAQPTYSNQVVHIEHILPHEASCAGLDEPLVASLQDCLEEHGISSLYTHQAEAVWFIVDGELEVNIDGESAILKTGDAIITPYGAMAGSKVISTTPVKLLVVASPNILRDLPHAHETPESH